MQGCILHALSPLRRSRFCLFTEKKHQHDDDDDDDSDMGPSIFTDTKSTIFSEVTTCYLTKYMCVHKHSLFCIRINWTKS